MRRATPEAMHSTPELGLVMRVPAETLAPAIPVPLVRLDPFAEPEPSMGATIELASGRHVVVIYGEVTGHLSVHVDPSAADEAIDNFLRETRLDPSETLSRLPSRRTEAARI